MLLKPCPSIIRRNASTLVGSHGFFRVQRSVHGFVGLLALCSTAAFSLFSNGILAVPLAHYSSASAPDFHRTSLVQPVHHRPQNRYAVFRQKKKPHRQTFCRCDRMFSHPAFLHPISGMRSGFSHGRYSGSAHLEGESLLRLYPAFSGFPNDRISPRIQASALTATGIARISTGSLISTPELSQPTQDMGHHAAIQLLKTNFCAILHMETENRKAGIAFVKESP